MLKQIGVMAAVVLAGVASAVTENWTKDAFKAGSWISTSDYEYINTTTTSFSIGIVFNIEDVSTFTSSSAMLFGARQNEDVWSSGTAQNPGIGIYANGTAVGNLDSSTGWSFEGSAYETKEFKNGTNTAVLTVAFSNIYGGSQRLIDVTYTFYVNGVAVGEWADTGPYFTAVSRLTSTYGELYAYKDAAEVWYMEGVADDADIASLPEPTALALLALGAAALVLRRKVA